MSNPNILFLPDGHRHWAREHNVPYTTSYELAAQRINDISAYLSDAGLSECWVGIMPVFTLKRSPDDLQAILDATLRVRQVGNERGKPLNVTFGGRLDLLPTHAERLRSQEATRVEGAFTVHLLTAWSTNNEVTDLALHAQAHLETPIDHAALVGQSVIKKHIDLVIRFGQSRLSSMIPWHSTDAELVFLPMYFPDFTMDDLDEVMNSYNHRETRNNAWDTADL